MEMTPLSSSNLSGMAYDADTRTLVIEFKNGSRYQLDGVEPSKADGLNTAESAGKYYYSELRGRYNEHRV